MIRSSANLGGMSAAASHPPPPARGPASEPARGLAGRSSLAGRRGQAARNDAVILDAARTVFLSDPRAPVAAVAAEPDAWQALTGFLQRIVQADVHSLTVHLAGTFTPTPQMNADAQRASALATALVQRAQAAGRLRPDVVPDDIDLILEGCAAIRVPDPARTGELRQRYLRLLVDGLASETGRAPLPGPPPHGDLSWRWHQR